MSTERAIEPTTTPCSFELKPVHGGRSWQPATWAADVAAGLEALMASEEALQPELRCGSVRYTRAVAGTGFMMTDRVGQSQSCEIKWSCAWQCYVVHPEDGYLFLVRRALGRAAPSPPAAPAAPAAPPAS